MCKLRVSKERKTETPKATWHVFLLPVCFWQTVSVTLHSCVTTPALPCAPDRETVTWQSPLSLKALFTYRTERLQASVHLILTKPRGLPRPLEFRRRGRG